MHIVASDHQQPVAGPSKLTWWAVLLLVLFVALAFAVATQLWSTIVPAYIRVTFTIALAILTILLGLADMAGDPLGLRRLLAAIFRGGIDAGPFDRWTVIHTSAGLIFGLWYLPLVFVLPVVVLWEVFEWKVPGFGDEENFVNRVIDVGVALIGWAAIVLIVYAVTGVAVPFLGRA